ncbi:hypothetical protein JCM10450v2_003701 [Rhodotorula kratochvilovae]
MGLARLLALATAMFLATLLAAFAPLVVHLSPRRLQAVSELSVGILVGAALGIILPEGVAAVFDNSPSHDDPAGSAAHEENAGWIGGALLSGFILMYIIDSVHGHDEYTDPDPQPHLHPRHAHHHRPHFHSSASHLAELEPLSNGAARNSNEYAASHDSADARWDEEHVGGGGGGSGASSRSRSPQRCDEAHVVTADQSSVSTVIGMLTHSLADGISLGASSLPLSSAAAALAHHSHDGGVGDGASSPLQLIVFLAIMLHKAPTAFALSSLLSSSPATSKAFTRRALLLFALAAPIGALATYALLSLLGAHGGAGSRAGWWTGLALVFSGGTFLFVATHAVREQEKRAEGVAHGEGERIGERQRLALVLVGMVTPALLSRLVGHGH